MDILKSFEQLEQLLVQPTLGARRRVYQTIHALLDQSIFPYESLGLMIHDQYGHPVVGGLEQTVWHSVWGEMAHSQSLLLQRLFGGAQALQQAQQQLLARYAIRQINYAIRRLIELHQQHFIYLNREDMQSLQGLYQRFAASVFVRYFDLVTLEGLLQAPHPDLIAAPSATRMVGLV